MTDRDFIGSSRDLLGKNVSNLIVTEAAFPSNQVTSDEDDDFDVGDGP